MALVVKELQFDVDPASWESCDGKSHDGRPARNSVWSRWCSDLSAAVPERARSSGLSSPCLYWKAGVAWMRGPAAASVWARGSGEKRAVSNFRPGQFPT